MLLSGKEIIEKGIVSGIDENNQKQACGIDLTVSKIEKFVNNGVVDFDNRFRRTPNYMEVIMRDSAIQDGENMEPGYLLADGCYLVTFNEVLNIPNDCCGMAKPRSTMLRCGATVETAVFDPGYVGRPKCLLIVHNRSGIVLGKNAKILQIVFFEIKDNTTGYSGQYQYENVDDNDDEILMVVSS